MNKRLSNFLSSKIIVARRSKGDIASEESLEIPPDPRQHSMVGEHHLLALTPTTVKPFLTIRDRWPSIDKRTLTG